MPIKLNKLEEKKKILSIAMQCFTTLGYSNTTMDYIAKKYGKSKASIYLHFKSKKAIFLALAEFWFQQFKKDLLPILHSHDQPENILSKIINLTSERIENDLPFFKAHLEFLRYSFIDSKAKNKIQKVYKFWTDELANIFLPICKSKQQSNQLAIYVISIYIGYIIRSITANDISIKDNAKFIQNITVNIINSLKKDNTLNNNFDNGRSKR